MRSILIASALGLAAGACTSAGTSSDSVQHVVFTTGTTLGVDIEAIGADGQAARVGYQRLEFVSLPARRTDGDLIANAFPVLSLFVMDTGELFSTSVTELRVLQVFATGKAATQVNAPEALAEAANTLATATLWTTEVADLTERTVDLVEQAWAKDPDAAAGAVSATLAGGRTLDQVGLDAAIAASEVRHPKMIRYAVDRVWLREVAAEHLPRMIAIELAQLAAHFEEARTLSDAIRELEQVTGD